MTIEIKEEKKTCTFEGCKDKHSAKGLCKRHYAKKYNAEHKERRDLRYIYRTGKHSTRHHLKRRGRVRGRLTGMIRRYLAGRKINDETARNIVGCTMIEFVAYVESKFKPGMSWNNYGKGLLCWSMDHIKPLCWFGLHNEEDEKRANHYTNLQPVSTTRNNEKGGIE